MAVLLQDSFTRADSAASPGSPEVGGPYSVVSGVWGVSSGQLYAVGPAPASGKQIITFPAAVDVDIQCAHTMQAGLRSGLIFRYIDDKNYWMLAKDSGLWCLARYANGAYSDVLGPVKYAVGTSSLRIVAMAKQISMFVNGAFVGSIEDSWYSQATPTCGFFLEGSSTAYRWDDVLAQSPVAAPGVNGNFPASVSDFQSANAPASLQSSAFVYRGRDTKTLDTAGVS